MTTGAFISIEHITDLDKRQEVLRNIRNTVTNKKYVWERYPDGGFTRKLRGVYMDAEEAIMFKLKHSI